MQNGVHFGHWNLDSKEDQEIYDDGDDDEINNKTNKNNNKNTI